MLAVPLKETKGLDWSGPLRTYISSNYSPEELDKHASSIQRLSTTRERVANATGAGDSSVEAMESYLTMLGDVEPRFPLGEGGLKLTFVWYDALRPTKKLSMTQFEFERASVLFNLAAVLSHQGMVQDRSDMGGLKKACAFFQRAAGIFFHLRDNVVGHRLLGPTLTDMSPDGLEMLTNLMLAQAQACFYEKAIRDELKPAILSKLSSQACEWYGCALEAASSSTLAATLDPTWAVHLDFQHKCFQASTQFQYAKVVHEVAEETTEGYGEEISRLGLASQLCEEAIYAGQKGRLPGSMLETVRHLRQVIHSRLDDASDDNNRIYMQPIPPARSLSTPPMAALAKPIAPPDHLAYTADISQTLRRGSDVYEEALFAGLLPVVMQEADTLYKSRLTHMVEEFGNKVQDATETVKLRLSEAGLPAAVEAGDASQDGIPEAVWTRIESGVLSRGGVSGLQGSLRDNDALAAKSGEELRSIEAKLQEEEQEDAACRSAWGELWTITPSANLSLHMRGDVSRYKSLVAEAHASDGVLREKLSASKNKMEILSYSRSNLDRMFPSSDEVDDNPDVEATRTDLALMLVDLGASIQELEGLQGQLVDETASDSIAAAMMSAPGGASAIAASESKLSKLIDSEMHKYDQMLEEMEHRIDDLPAMLSKVLDLNFEFSKMRGQSEGSIKREGLIAEIDQAIEAFDELATYILEGEKFYLNLSGRIEQLRTTAMDHCYVRELQRKELETELSSRFGGGPPSAQQQQQQQQRQPQGAYPGMDRPGYNRMQSQPLMTPYAVGSAGDGAAQAFPMGRSAVQTVPAMPAYPMDSGGSAPMAAQVSAPPPPSYSSATGGSTGDAAKIAQMRAALGNSVSDERLAEALDGAGGDVNRAINHILGAEPSPSSKRTSKKRFGWR
ncbi:pH-response regulator protein palA/RIM20 [Hondaea fermentalgiana]|uniref:pH-response regulator protein palA/RIM20 n=1 Tax=Hondaea fermentalgiana TaxID=2315210 RepID=A0A2R5GTM8_9STRA|nr:pH-response regulator protein palA/RIM20 [Hondaea fermentalgiana]|eukprot:GBG34200.1 pH-response regulator protein palA/RIM20 [Hondaea fermentalgiana]